MARRPGGGGGYGHVVAMLLPCCCHAVAMLWPVVAIRTCSHGCALSHDPPAAPRLAPARLFPHRTHDAHTDMDEDQTPRVRQLLAQCTAWPNINFVSVPSVVSPPSIRNAEGRFFLSSFFLGGRGGSGYSRLPHPSPAPLHTPKKTTTNLFFFYITSPFFLTIVISSPPSNRQTRRARGNPAAAAATLGAGCPAGQPARGWYPAPGRSAGPPAQGRARELAAVVVPQRRWRLFWKFGTHCRRR